MPEAQLTPEQRKELQEKLKNMSPEELREFQKQQCLFCRIAEKNVDAKAVYEDDRTLAFLDINPAAKGHVILMPKEHYVISPQVPDKEMGHLFIVAKKLSHAVLKGLKAHGTTIFVANGLAAGQKSQHFMIHIIPREEGDGFPELPLNEVDEEDLEKLGAALRPKINEAFGKSAQTRESHSLKGDETFSKEQTGQETELMEEPPLKDRHVAQDAGDVDEDDVLAELGNQEEEGQSLPEKKPATKKKKQSKKKSKKKETKDEQDANNEEGEVSLDDIAGLFT